MSDELYSYIQYGDSLPERDGDWLVTATNLVVNSWQAAIRSAVIKYAGVST